MIPKSHVVAFLFLLTIQIVHAQHNCELKTSDKGIDVYLCETEGSPFKTIRVDFIAKATLKEYAAGVLDIANYPKWQSNILQPHILQQTSDTQLIYYCEVDTPWPVSHRDLIFKLDMSQDAGTKALTVTLEQLPEFIPKVEDLVRIPKANSTLTVTPIDKQHVKVNYTIHLDIGGYVPPFIVNLFATQTPWNTFNNYRARLESGAVSARHIDFIENY